MSSIWRYSTASSTPANTTNTCASAVNSAGTIANSDTHTDTTYIDTRTNSTSRDDIHRIGIDVDNNASIGCSTAYYYSSSRPSDTDMSDFTQSDFFQEGVNNIHSHLSPVLFVIDFDHTLALYDDDYWLDDNASGKLRSVYSRPFLYQFLDFLKSVNRNNVLILWTAGTDSYIKQNLLLLNIAQYFTHVLSREHCIESEKIFGVKKSHQYLVRKFPRYSNVLSVLIDNYAISNGSGSGYCKLISIKPFNVSDIVNAWGAFGISPVNICNIKKFLKTKGRSGTTKTYKAKNCKNNNNNYGDTALLNTMEYLQKEFFSFSISQLKHNSQTPLRVNKVYCITSSAALTANNSDDTDSHHRLSIVAQSPLSSLSFSSNSTTMAPIMFFSDDIK